MAFITENGSGVVGATAYGTVQGFKDYHGDRGTDVSVILDATIQTLLVKAADYIDSRWGHLFKGAREHAGLVSRSVLTLTDVPAEDETVVVGSVTYTFKAVPDENDDTEVEIGSNMITTLAALSAALGASDNEDFVDTFFADVDVASMTIFVSEDGTATTETLGNGSFDQPTSYGSSYRVQPLEFPRSDLYDSEGYLIQGIPDQLLESAYEYALRANSAALAADPTVDSGGDVIRQKNKVGPIETETEYSSGSTPNITTPYPAADRLLREFVSGSTNTTVRN